MQDGTYIKLGDNAFARVEATTGYWVASRQTTLEDAEKNQLIGVWTDTETGRIWVDNTFWFATKDGAITFARIYEQLAIWDVENNTEIRLDN